MGGGCVFNELDALNLEVFHNQGGENDTLYRQNTRTPTHARFVHIRSMMVMADARIVFREVVLEQLRHGKYQGRENANW